MNIVCTVWQPKLAIYVPLAKNMIVYDKCDKPLQYYRATEGKYHWNESKWKIFCRKESEMYASGKWMYVDNIQTAFEYDWRCHYQFFITNNNIVQVDGPYGDINSANAGERLRAMIDDFTVNENEIKETIEEIEEEGINEDGVHKHARFNDTGLAIKESSTK